MASFTDIINRAGGNIPKDTNPIRNLVNGSTQNKGQITINVGSGTSSNKSGGSSGGGRRRSNEGFSSANPLLNNAAPQSKSQAEQSAALSLARQNVQTQRDAVQREQNYVLLNSSKESGFSSANPLLNTNPKFEDYGSFEVREGNASKNTEQRGVLFLKQGENVSGLIPTYNLQSSDNMSVISEAAFASQLPIVGNPRTSAEVQYNKVITSQGEQFYRNEVIPFRNDPAAYATTGKAIGFSSEGGETFKLNENVANPYFSGESLRKANQRFSPVGYEYNKNLSPFDVGSLTATQLGVELGRFGQGIIDITGTVGKTIYYNIGVKGIDKSNNPLSLNIKQVSTPDVFGFKSAKAVQYGVDTFNVPLLGVQLPKRFYSPTEVGQFATETVGNPGNLLAIGNTLILADLGIGGIKRVRETYGEVRGLGYTKGEAFNIVAGETVSSFNPIRSSLNENIIFPKTSTGDIGTYIETGIPGGGTFKGGIKGMRTRQANVGAELTNTKVGEVGDINAYNVGGFPEQALYSKAGTLTYTSRLKGLTRDYYSTEKVALSELQSVSIREGLFGVKGIPDRADEFSISGKGEREIFTSGYRPVQTSQFRIGTEKFDTKLTQSFEVGGYGKVLSRNDGLQTSFSLGKSKFKNIRFDIIDVENAVYKESKLSGFTGRPSTGKGFEFNFELGKITTDLGTESYGRSVGRLFSGRKRTNVLFNTKSVVPNELGIKIDFKESPRGLNTRPSEKPGTYTKGEFDYLSEGVKQQTIVRQLPKSAGRSAALTESKSLTSQRLEITQASSLGLRSLSALGLNLRIGNGLRTNQLYSLNSLSLTQTRQVLSQNEALGQVQVTNQSFNFRNDVGNVFSNIGRGGGVPGVGITPITPIPGFGLPSLGGYAIGNPKGLGTKSKAFDISPSFTGIVANLKISSPVKVSKTFGVTPFQTRGLLTGKARRGSYFKIVDF